MLASALPAAALDIASGGGLRLEDRAIRLADVVVPQDAHADDARGWRIAAASGHDRWQHDLAAVVDQHGVSLASDLVAAGEALVSPDAGGPDLAALLRDEAAARSAGLGLWGQRRWQVQAADDVRGRPGDLVLVEGRPQQVAWAGDVLYLNFGADRKQDFTVRAERPATRLLAHAGVDVKALAGRNLRVRGWLMYVGGPMIDVTGPAQIELLP